MTESKIDVKHLNELADGIDILIEHIEDEKELMLDAEEDIFNRYMAYHRLISFMSTYRHLMDMTITSFRLGNDLQNSVFQTKEHKKRGWMNPSCAGNPFFDSAQDSEEEEENEEKCKHKVVFDDDVPDEVKEAIKSLFKLSIKKKKK